MKKIFLVFVFVFVLSVCFAAPMSEQKFTEFVKYATVDEVKLEVENGASVNAVGKYGYTPLISALITNNKPVINYLLDNSADINAKDDTGKTPLMYAVIYGTDYKIIDRLIKLGADCEARETQYGYTPLMYTIIRRQSKLVKNKNNLPVFAKLLLDAGASMHTVDFQGYSPLEYVSYCFDNYFLKYIFEDCSKIYVRKKLGVPDKIFRYSETHETWTYKFSTIAKNKKQKETQENWSILFVIDNDKIMDVSVQ